MSITLAKTYATRRNAPYPAESTQAIIRKSQAWLLKEFLKGSVVSGTLQGTRHANSLWTCYYSCDSVTAGTAGDGVDRWTTYANVVNAASGSAHSWWCGYNAATGIYCLIDVNNTTNSARISFSFVAYTGGTTTLGPTSTEGWCAGTTTVDATATTTTFVGDDVVTSTHYASFVTSDDGRFLFIAHRAGLGVISSLVGLWPTTGNDPSDTRNWFAFCSAGVSGRGAGVISTMSAAGAFIARTPNNLAVTAGGASGTRFGGIDWAGNAVGIDAVRSQYPGPKLELASLSPQACFRGVFDDIRWACGAPSIAMAYPAAGASQTHTVVGDLFVPFTGGPPTV